MEFALFYEIPVARPWSRTSELEAYQATRSSRRWPPRPPAGTRSGRSSTTSSRSTRTARTPRSSTARWRRGPSGSAIGYGVRLGAAPLQPSGPIGRVGGRAGPDQQGAGSSSAPADPRPAPRWRASVSTPTRPARCGTRRCGHIVGCWTNDEYEFEGEYWSMPRRRVLPKPIQDPHPPIWGATGSESGHRMMGELGLGLLSFSVGTPPERAGPARSGIYREGLAACTAPMGATINPRAACFTMVNCAASRARVARGVTGVLRVVPRRSAQLVASVPKWLDEMKAETYGTYDYLKGAVEAEPLPRPGHASTRWSRRRRASAGNARRGRRGGEGVRGHRSGSAAAASSTRTRSRTTRSCRPSISWAAT